MKSSVLLSLLILCEIVASRPCLGDDGSARRYADIKSRDEISLAFCLLLNQANVQSELKLSAKQLETVKHASMGAFPGEREFFEDYRKRLDDPTLSAADKKKLEKARSDEWWRRSEAYRRQQLSATLSANQRQRLDELLITSGRPDCHSG
jgi:hypothetical protein